MEEWQFGEELPPPKGNRTPVKTQRATTDVTTEEVFEGGILKHYHSCSCGYTTTGCFNLVGAAKTLDFHVKVRHTR